MPFSDNGIYEFYVAMSGTVAYSPVTDTRTVRPVLYLNSNVKIVSGSGKSGDEFILG